MLLLAFYIFVALFFSFVCSIAEAVLLSVSQAYIRVLQQEKKRAGVLLQQLKQDIDRPLAAILTLNTIAHTMGAAGAGAQAALVFGEVYMGLISALLTLMILVFSEIIPKTLGAHYWRQLAPLVAYFLPGLVKVLYPFVWLAKKLTSAVSQENAIKGFNRQEFAAMAELGKFEGELEDRESHILHNLLRLREMRVTDIMTPRPVLFSLPQQLSVTDFFVGHEKEPFSRILLYDENPDQVLSFVLKSDLLLAQVDGKSDLKLGDFERELAALGNTSSVWQAFEEMLTQCSQIVLIVNEYGVVEGIVTLEDIFESLLGLEIMDEVDKTKDLQELARRFGRRRARAMGLKSPELVDEYEKPQQDDQ